MGIRFYCSGLAPFVLLLILEIASAPTGAQEIPLKHCDALPVIEVTVGSQAMLFLVDTAATSILNLKSFAEGKTRAIEVTSWTGTLATSAREVTLREVAVGDTKLTELKLPAVDLSAVGKACGRKIDGILGVDLLAKLGATIDLKKQTVHVTTLSEDRGDTLAAEMQSEMHLCLVAFNESDENAFAECLDPKIVLFSGETELYGREQAIGYFRERYFHQKPAARLNIRESAFHAIGEAVWYEYEFTIESARGVLRGRGMAMCKKSEGRWRMASMHHSVMEMDHSAAAK
ncbi:MAG TPA: nuclear transport factor 2 family protein [Candidatus Acidoferrum sp.]|nr:nuclear transport factor 2 family protein [Candidatus Acidoferrum sp.]